MKLATNFSTSACRMAPILTVVLWGMVLSTMLVISWLWMETNRLGQSRIELTEYLTKLDAKQAISHPQNSPDYEDLAALKSRLSAVSLLLNGENNSLSSFLARIELLLPAEAYLISLQFRKNKNIGEIQILVESTRVGVLAEFMRGLEKEKAFAEVLLIRQSQRISSDTKLVQFELRIRERLL